MGAVLDYYDRNGEPITSTEEWCAKFRDHDYQRVARDEVDGVVVSTVWLGLDHNSLGSVPHIFETMVFGGELDEHCWRYSTEAQAIAGHDQVLAEVRNLAAATPR